MNPSNGSEKQPANPKLRNSRLKKTGIALAASAVMSVLAFGSAVPSQAITTQDPGPVGDFNWEGLNWHKRSWGGGPHYNGQWQASNVGNPDANGDVTLSLTNPTGNAPQAAEMQTTKRGFGYGTYTTTVEKQVDAMQPEVVWGCMFTYDPDATPGFGEIDLCEASAWGGGAAYGQNWPISQGHGYWFDASLGAGNGNVVTTFAPPTTLIQTHKLVWEKDKLTFETYEGEGLTSKLVKQTILTGDKVPEPGQERIHYNLWVIGGNGGDPDHVDPETVKIKSLTFVPAAPVTTPTATPTPTPTATAPAPSPTATAPAPSPTATATPTATPTPTPTVTQSVINLSVVAYKPATGYYAVLKWTGAKGNTVDLYFNGKKTTVPNNGYYKYMRPAGEVSTTFKMCDYTGGCSKTWKVSKW